MLADADARVMPSVLTALTKLKAPGIDEDSRSSVSASEDVGIRAAAATNLGELKPEGGVERSMAAYKRGEADLVIDTRAAALEALSKYGAAAALPTLRAALGDKDWAVQGQGRRAAEDARSRRSRPPRRSAGARVAAGEL